MLRDQDIRPALCSWLRVNGMDERAVLLEEVGLCRGQVRLDLMLVNGLIHGYEIKSDIDTLRRLASQARVYSKVLDRATLVAGERHLEMGLALLPKWWGVLSVRADPHGPRFTHVRGGRTNPGRDARAIVELLWLDDALDLLVERDAARGVRGKPRRVVWERVCESYTLNEIANAVRLRLRARAVRQGPAQP